MALGMGNTDGDKKSGRKQSAAGQKSTKPKSAAVDDQTQLLIERDNLRAELAKSARRIKSLEDANRDVAKRLDVAIGSVKELLAKD